MSLHTGIEPSKEIDVSQLNIPTKKYVDDQDKLRLAKSGGTMTGEINMGVNKIISLDEPTNRTDATTKYYVDNLIGGKLNRDGSQFMTGDLDMADNKITYLDTPTDDQDASTKKYVDDQAALKLDLAGGSMTGPLGLGNGRLWDVGTPTLDTNGANKKYVDDKFNSVKESNYFVFEFKSTANDTWKQAENLTGHMFWTNNRNIKLTLLAHVFDDDNSLPSSLSLSYRIYWWSKTGVGSDEWRSFWKIKCTKSTVSGTSLQSYPVGRSFTINDISALTIKYRYLHSSSVGNESALHCLIEYV